ncbi:MAG: MBL fold metallo-hydrolase [bacterium (Candidatus Stahlbacteria) CG23_combo_of_CG06-09_8_20_14_all_34_7]|nr:MAG: MBL fold metallo-hydrolase [bacterium (Candidatus Stahlbacteria) CG23_combo_of_CG06-09_8_20_14_all_34_7]
MLKLIFWGVRGSVPSPGKLTSYFGGNTTCITIENKSTFIIIDGGTGIRNVGDYVSERNFRRIRILFTHYHWDHLQGLPFFAPIFNPKYQIDIFGKRNVSNVLSQQMKRPFFPADYKNLPSKINHQKMNLSFSIDDILVETIENNHPSGCVGLRFTYKEKRIVFMTDNELSAVNPTTKRNRFIDFIKNSDIFIHDSQYTEKEIDTKRGWGHSTFDEVISLAKDASLDYAIFTHHDPMRNDSVLKNIVSEKSKKHKKMTLLAARENLELKI